MKSKNNLTITGIIVTDVTISPERSYARFTLVHNFGGRIPSLYLRCLIPGRILDDTLALGPGRGVSVCVSAYIRPHRDGVQAVVKSMETINL